MPFYNARKNTAFHSNHRGRRVAMAWCVRPNMVDTDQFPGGALPLQFLLDIIQENMSLAISQCLGDDAMLLDHRRSFVQLPDGGAHGFACHLQALFVCKLRRGDPLGGLFDNLGGLISPQFGVRFVQLAQLLPH